MDAPDAGPHGSLHPAAAGARAMGGSLWARTALLVVPAAWLGMIVGISLIEAPLKFTAPGITLPLGLGIGRRVFFAMNLVEVVLAVVLLVALWRCLGRPGRQRLWVLGGAATAVLVAKVAVIRPFLNARTDAVLAGDFAGGSMAHYVYVGAEALLVLTLGALLLTAARAVVAPAIRS
ncbi:MAG: hypothetical protein QJR09_12775 [Micrococcus sp.]|nr:hypothetical protein [Micrococcus sp.]